ncbi:hypothetical protein PRIPAC_73074 [Pristionchus pacificus]|uniref:Uncharacterized protein n=1 Tax=Pristionchus pacificus TaxID=54126 RepID=A0A2A6B577_PRIPA|nr:hypothetical protein PRIPAC_73074 [Pristionchus pacificus]|eukprot:PDM61030.1 hypothetical protein PRIPAC_54836 [Pristionchus pacificus]
MKMMKGRKIWRHQIFQTALPVLDHPKVQPTQLSQRLHLSIQHSILQHSKIIRRQRCTRLFD